LNVLLFVVHVFCQREFSYIQKNLYLYYINMSWTPIDTILPAFDSTFVLDKQVELYDIMCHIDVSAEITLTQRISAADMFYIFYFRTDEDITSIPVDSSSVDYFLDQSKFTGAQATMNPMNGLVTSGYYGSNTTDHLAKDFLRDMAQQLFNTHFGVDLFTNEDAIVTDISARSAMIGTNIYNILGDVDINNTSLEGPDVSYGYYTTDTYSHNTNITREILNHYLSMATIRFEDLTLLRIDPNIPGVYGIPFVTGDTISYKLLVTANTSQNITIDTNKPTLKTRSYRVKFVVS